MSEYLKLLSKWDNQRLSPCGKQISISLPFAVENRIDHLCKCFPSQTRTKIISDLLLLALYQVQESKTVQFPKEMGVIP